MQELKGLKGVRERKGLTVRELAGKAGMGSSTISQLENGRRRARLSTTHKLAEVLGVMELDLLRAGFYEMDEKQQATTFFLEDEAWHKLIWLPDELLHWHALKVLDEERRRGLKPASIEEIMEIEQEGKRKQPA